MTIDDGNPGSGLRQAQQCGEIKLINRISITTLSHLIIESDTSTYICVVKSIYMCTL